ncbi:MAG: MMPL family transporter, partial [Fidelibacterota bacterium]
MREKILIKLAHWSVYRTRWFLLVVTILTGLFAGLASRMQMTTKWSDMLPKGDRRTVEFDRILDEFVSASSIVIVAQGEEKRIKAFADSLAPRLLRSMPVPGRDSETRVFVRRVDYKQEMEFVRRHGLMLMKTTDLENTKDIFQDPGLIPLLTHVNDSFEKEYIEAEQALSSREKEDGAFMFLDGIETWLGIMERHLAGEQVSLKETHEAADKLLTGEPYFMSYDRGTLILNAIPNFSLMDMDLMVKGTDAVQAVVDETLKSFPGVRAGLTGAIPLGHDEMVYGMQGLEYTSTIALIAIGILLIVSFRMWAAPILALLNLVIGLIWAAGVVVLFVPVLNIMTAMFVVVLLGLGIDFSIHIIASVTEMRALGHPLDRAMEEGLLKSGKGVMTGAVTTASAFFALMIGDSRAISEMGLVTGIGLLAVAASTFTLLPALLAVGDRWREKYLKKKSASREIGGKDISFTFLGRVGSALKERYVFTTLGAIIITALLMASARNITFDYNYMNIEPEGIPSITLQDTVLDKFDLSMDFAYLMAESVEESRQLAAAARKSHSVALVEDISLYLPSTEDQAKRRPHVEEIRGLMSRARVAPLSGKEDVKTVRREVNRLRMNVMELQDLAFLGGQDVVYEKCKNLVGDPEKGPRETVFTRLDSILSSADAGRSLSGLNAFQKAFSGYFRQNVIAMA